MALWTRLGARERGGVRSRHARLVSRPRRRGTTPVRSQAFEREPRAPPGTSETAPEETRALAGVGQVLVAPGRHRSRGDSFKASYSNRTPTAIRTPSASPTTFLADCALISGETVEAETAVSRRACGRRSRSETFSRRASRCRALEMAAAANGRPARRALLLCRIGRRHYRGSRLERHPRGRLLGRAPRALPRRRPHATGRRGRCRLGRRTRACIRRCRRSRTRPAPDLVVGCLHRVYRTPA